MKPSPPWSVKGVGDEARETARKAAQAAGLTLGAWIDRAIRKSTGLPAEPPKSPFGTTSSTTSRFSPPNDPPETPEVEYDDTLSDRDRWAETGSPESIASDEGSAREDSDEPDIPDRLQVDPEERFSATVTPADNVSDRTWIGSLGLDRIGARPVHLWLAASVVIAGLGIYWLASSEPGEPDPTAPATLAEATESAAPPSPAAPDADERDDGPAPSEPGVIEMLTAAAEQGDPVAQHDLAVRYLEGRTIGADPGLAFKWMERAASKGMAQAQYRLGVMYANGTGVKADPNRAATWYTNAAMQGHPGAQHALALAYAEGRGVARSEASAVEWLMRAGRAGNVPSQVLLGDWYAAGHGVAKDPAKAIEWYRRAAAKGNAGAATRVKELEKASVARSPAAPAFAATKPARAASPDTPLDKTGIAEVQRLLTRLAFKPGPADGKLGPRTIREIKLYQRFAGLPDDGKATRGLLLELREMAQGMSATARPAAKR